MANLPDFINMQGNRDKKLTTAEMLDQIKRKDELDRVNRKFGKAQSEVVPLTPGKHAPSDDTLQKTTNLMDEAELLLLLPNGCKPEQADDSNLLQSITPDDVGTG